MGSSEFPSIILRNIAEYNPAREIERARAIMLELSGQNPTVIHVRSSSLLPRRVKLDGSMSHPSLPFHATPKADVCKSLICDSLSSCFATNPFARNCEAYEDIFLLYDFVAKPMRFSGKEGRGQLVAV